jgi:ABC-type glutathione transport system ATPase component
MADEWLRVRGLSKRYLRRSGLLRSGDAVEALVDVDLSLERGRTLALVGESGSGKSTLARCLALLERPDSGEIRFEGRDLVGLPGAELGPVRSRIQLIFQDSAQALNPRLTALEIVEEPLLIQRRGSAPERRGRALQLMESVELAPAWAGRRPFELSGGQRQRLAIARALALEPALLILDEALAGLDALVQAQVVKLLRELQASRALGFVFVSHDLALMGRIADEVAVLHGGRIVEQGPASALCNAPKHPQTQALVHAIPALPC